MHIIQPSRFAELLAKVAAARPGLWANIRAKKKRGESAAKPGDEDYPDSKNWSKVTAISEKKVEKQALASIFKALGQGALRAMSKAPMTTAAVGIGGAGAYEATRPTNKLIPQILPNATGAAPPTPPLNEKAGYVIAALAKLAVDQAGGSYLNAQNTINAQRVAQIKADAERVRIASGAPKPSGNGTYSYSGTVFPNRVENAQHSFTPPAAQGQGEFPRQPVQAPSMRGDTTPTFNNPTPPTSNNTFAPRMANPTPPTSNNTFAQRMAKPTNPPPANRWKPIDISGDRRRKEKEMGWAPNSMDQGGSRYGENGPRSAELAKAPASISNTYVAPPGEDPQHTALNKAMFDIKKEQRVALTSGKTWSPSGVNIINPVKPTAMAQAPAPKAPSNTYATSRFSSNLPSWATQGR